MSFARDGFGRRIAENFTAETEGGKGSGRGNLLPSKRDCPSGVGTRPTPAKRDDTRSNRPTSSKRQGFGQMDPLVYRKRRRHQRLLAGVSSFDLSVYVRHLLFIAGQKPTHTSNCGVVSAS